VLPVAAGAGSTGPMPVLLALLAVLLAGREAAATITINLNAETHKEENVALTVAAENSGDEAARDVEPEVIYQGKLTRGDALAALERGARHEWKFDLPLPPGPGTFPMTIRMHYADANGYPLSALLVHLVRTPGPAGPVRPTLSAGAMARFANARLLLENPGPQPVAGRVAVVLPSEFRTEPESMPAQVPPQGRVEVPFVVQNGSALTGSVYPVYAIFEYDLGGNHQTVVSDTSIKVVAIEPSQRRPMLIGVAALAAVIVVFGFALRRAGRRRGAPA